MSDMEEGELGANSEDDDVLKNRRSPSKQSLSKAKRRMESREDPVTQRPLPSPVQSDDENTLTVDMDALETFGVTKQPKPKVYENPSQDSFVLGFDPNSQEALKRKEERAKRFGIANTSSVINVNEEELRKLYDSLGLSENEATAGFGERGIRLETVHLRGTDNMSTEDVFSYFQDYTPKFIEWIDDSSCNVIWHDKVSAAKAILSKSIDPNSQNEKPKDKVAESMETGDEENKKDTNNETENPQSKEPLAEQEEEDDELNLLSSDEDEDIEKKKEDTSKSNSMQNDDVGEDVEMKDENSTATGEQNQEKESKSNSIQFSNTNLIKRVLPPGNWRIGQPCEKAKLLYMRFANKADKKRPGAERRSQYYREYGNPNFGGMKGLISSSRKRRLVSNKYRQEVQEARQMVRKTEKFYHGIPEESTFDRHLREAKRAKNMYTVAAKNSDFDDDENESEDDQAYMLNQYHSNVDDDVTWGQTNVVEDEDENKPEGQEEELDFELELGELMKKAPTYRVGRMYADDLEEEIKIKREAAAEITKEVLAKRDARSQIEEKRQRKGHSHHHHHRSHTHRRKHHTHSDDDILVVNLQNDGSDQGEEKNELVVEGEDLRQKVRRHKEGHRSHHKRRKEKHRHDRSRRKEVAENVEDSPVEDLIMDDVPESNFKYEKLRIQVDPDDV